MASQHSHANLELEIGGPLKFIESRTSAVTTSWGVAWDEVYIARDLMQNFYDANRNRLSEIRVVKDQRKVTISAPVPFLLDRLFYLGSEKGASDVGQFGEGFKVAATCLLRDHDIEPIAISGDQVVCMRISENPVTDTALQPVIYDFFRSNDPFEGTKLVLRGCSPRLSSAIEQGLTHFFFESNPLLGPRLWSSWDKLFSIYKSQSTSGHVFYKNLKRGEIPGIPIILIIEKEYALIEKRIKYDRDRNAFGGELMNIFYRIFAKSALKHNEKGQRVVVESAANLWQHGHPLLSEIAEAIRYNSSWSANSASAVFGNGYFARCSTSDPAEEIEFARLDREWQNQGRICLPAYFCRFGVLNARTHSAEVKAKALKDATSKHHREPTLAEKSCLGVLTNVLNDLAPEIAAIFKRSSTTYTVAETETVLGELRRARDYRSYSVFFSTRIFESEFAHALAVFLHEHAHIFGHDGNRGFTDALTEMLEAAVRQRADLAPHEMAWNAAEAQVKQERRSVTPGREETLMDEILQQLSVDELRLVLRKLPRSLVKRALEKPRDV